MKKYDVEALQAMIDALSEYPKMDEIAFADFMSDNFGTVIGDIEYEFHFTTSPHLHVIRSVGDNLEISFTWSCAIETMIELQWFVDRITREE